MWEWSSPVYVTSQVFISLAYILLAITYFITHRWKLLLTTIISNVFMGIGFILLGGWVAVCMCGIAIFRDIVNSAINSHRNPKQQSKITKLDWFLLAVWISLFSIATFLTQTGFMTFFAFFATITFTVSIWQKNPLVYRILGIFVGIFWIIYNIVVQSFMGIFLESTLLVFVIIGLITYCQKSIKK